MWVGLFVYVSQTKCVPWERHEQEPRNPVAIFVHFFLFQKIVWEVRAT